jgi:hypothetical protein
MPSPMDTKPAPIIPAAEEKSITHSQPSSERSIKLEKRFEAQTLALAIATPLLSGFLAWIAIAYQLSNQHSFDSQQKSEERQQRLIDEKRRLFGETARLLGEMSGVRRQFISDLYELGVFLNSKAAHGEFGEKSEALSEREIEQYLRTTREDSARISSITAEVDSLCRICSVIFGSKVKSAIQEFMTFRTDRLVGFDKIPPEPSDYEATRAAQSTAEDKYQQSVNAVIDAMASEVRDEFTTTSK